MDDYVDLTATFLPKEGEAKHVKHAVEVTARQVVQEPGCIRYEITESTEDRIVLTERWENQASLDAHSPGRPVRELNEMLTNLLREPIKLEFQ
ncbi:antibiotic biosynthesis monooxygenase [Arthrobacter deserti]|uniref:Antibiotic biosynthesis monooxygenase n=1 Tax=Arthrobacter deserti TaxID=1742687 RepID=A0ABX1JNW1_9MICC|nr:antibiotic biosynthesis monooxygenase [Arthrobacter deserti]